MIVTYNTTMTSKEEEQSAEENPSVPDLPAANNKLAGYS